MFSKSINGLPSRHLGGTHTHTQAQREGGREREGETGREKGEGGREKEKSKDVEASHIHVKRGGRELGGSKREARIRETRE